MIKRKFFDYKNSIGEVATKKTFFEMLYNVQQIMKVMKNDVLQFGIKSLYLTLSH